MARATDPLRCILRWHEVNPTMSDRFTLIAYEQDGEPLRLVVSEDERGRGYLRGLALLTILDRNGEKA